MKHLPATARLISLTLCIVMLFCACSHGEYAQSGTLPLVSGSNSMSAAIIFDSACSDGSWRDTFDYLEQSLTLGISANFMDVSKSAVSFSDFDIIYLDSSLAQSEKSEEVSKASEDFVSNGGTAVLANELYATFDAEFIGAASFKKLTDFPYGMVSVDAGQDLNYIEGIITDFSYLYQNYPEFASDLYARDYGYMAECSTAQPLIGYGSYALYSVNYYGSGCVFFTNPLLPNFFSISGFSMEKRSEKQAAFASTTASCNQLLVNAFAEYAFLRRYGYSMSRVFGSYGGTNMAWELHYEEITGIENNACEIFGNLCREYNQIPSYTLIRNTYKWFLRAESISYLLNSSADSHQYQMDYNESAYSSGTHIAAGSTWLSINSIENGGSYFSDYPEYNYRAYPALGDFDGDGKTDIVSGSEDGCFYFFKGQGFSDRLHADSAVKLTDSSGSVISVSGFSSPVLYDVNGDGILDIISGSDSGDVVWFAGNGKMDFNYSGVLVSLGNGIQTMPSVGDLDGDGKDDLVVGTSDGRILAVYGSMSGSAEDITASIADISLLGSWLCPCVYDYNGDGASDLVIGTFDGYSALRFASADSFEDGGYISCDEMNYKGNRNIKFGNYCVPRFYDLDGDGADDLVCGSLEYGMAVPIDSEYFPYRSQLNEQLEYMKENAFYCGAHFYTNKYASEEREDYELTAQIKSRLAYGDDILSGNCGANQHTWYTSTGSTAQSFLNLWKNGLKWDSGFMSANAASAYPQQNPQNVISLPFFLEQDGDRTLLMQNNSTVLYTDDSFTDFSAKYGMPVCMYYHCDFAYQSEETARSYIKTAEDFREQNGYNFVGEDQMMYASAAEYNLSVAASVSGGNLSLVPTSVSEDANLYSEAYQCACGVRIRFASGIDVSSLGIDADVWRTDGNTLYVGLNRPVKIDFNGGKTAKNHIEKINVPASVSVSDGGTKLEFSEKGLLQVSVYGSASTPSEDWSTTSSGTVTTFTKYCGTDSGDQTLEINYD